jgi:hypothetical protein
LESCLATTLPAKLRNWIPSKACATNSRRLLLLSKDSINTQWHERGGDSKLSEYFLANVAA